MTSIISKKITPISVQPPTNTTSMIGSAVSSALHKVVSFLKTSQPMRVFPSDSEIHSVQKTINHTNKIFIDDDYYNNTDDCSTACISNVSSFTSTESAEEYFDVKYTEFDIEQFEIISQLGSGSYGTVYFAERSVDKKKYALKKIPKHEINAESMEHIMNEKKILESMDSPFVLRLFGTCQTKDDLFFITEAIERGDLYSAIYNYKKLSHAACVFYSACIILALDYIHAKGIVFRDLKPENIMIDSIGYPRIIDFGLAKQLPVCDLGGYEKTHTMCGTPEYLAPELIFSEGYDHLIDLWSLGVVMYEMIARRTPFVGYNNSDITQLFINISQSRKNGIVLSQKIDKMTDGTAHARDIITQLLDGVPSRRLGKHKATVSLLQNNYFSTVCSNSLITRTFTAPCLQPEYYGEDPDPNSSSKPYSGNQNIFVNF